LGNGNFLLHTFSVIKKTGAVFLSGNVIVPFESLSKFYR